MRIGGGGNHRMGLYDMVMVKDNHIAAAGGIAAAVAGAEGFMRGRGISRPVEVEGRTLGEVREVLGILDAAGGKSGITRIMLDNMARRDAAAPGAGRLRRGGVRAAAQLAR